jgi:nucleotide-binding universal stress UspA family protein
MQRIIVVPLDGSQLSEQSIPRATHLARTLGGALHLVRVHIPILAYQAAESAVAIPDPALDEQVRKADEEWLVRKAAQVKASAGVPVTFELRVGAPADEVVRVATERDAAYIVTTTHGHGGWAPQWLGSVADAIIRHAPCPVLAMSESSVAAPVDLHRILVPLDGSEASAAILTYVREIARATGATVDLFRVVEPPLVGDVMNAVQRHNVDRFGIDAGADIAKVELDRVAQDLAIGAIHATTSVAIANNPTRAILDREAETKPDLVAMSTYGRGISRLFVGSVADKVLRAGSRPVLSWRPAREVPEPDTARMFATAASGAV